MVLSKHLSCIYVALSCLIFGTNKQKKHQLNFYDSITTNEQLLWMFVRNIRNAGLICTKNWVQLERK
jgi:hypothetical protein